MFSFLDFIDTLSFTQYIMTRGYFLTSGIDNGIETYKTFFMEKNQMSKIQINDLNDLNVEHFATLTDLEAAGIQGGLMYSASILEMSSGMGHLGRAFAVGYIIGTALNNRFRISDAIVDAISP